MSPPAPLLAGIDIGTTRVKAGIIGLDGNELAHATAATVWQRTNTGAEARPDDFLSAARGVLSTVLAAAPPGPVLGLGVASMAETAILLDGERHPIGPAVAWYDRRARGDFTQLLDELGPGEYGRRTGLTSTQIPTVAMLRWLLRAYPGLRRATHALSVSEWVVHGLGGAVAVEPSLASRTGGFDVGAGDWWRAGLDWAGLAPSLFGELRAAGESWGVVRPSGRGLERLADAALTVAGHDHLVAAVGCGVTGPDQALDSCGTAEAIVRAVPEADAAPPEAGLSGDVASGRHVLPRTRSLLVGLRLGIELNGVLSELGVTARHGLTPVDREVVNLLESGEPISAGSASAQRWHAALAATVEQAASALAHVEQLGGPLAEVRVSGGWAANPVLVALKRRALVNPAYPVVTEAGVRGAALLAGQAAGVFASAADFPAPELADVPVVASEIVVPPPLSGPPAKQETHS